MLYVLKVDNYSMVHDWHKYIFYLFMVIYDNNNNNSVPTGMWEKHKHLHFRKKCSFLQFILVFIIQLSCTAFLHQKQLIFDVILYVVYLVANTTHMSYKHEAK